MYRFDFEKFKKEFRLIILDYNAVKDRINKNKQKKQIYKFQIKKIKAIMF